MEASMTSFLGDDNFLTLGDFAPAQVYLKIESFNPAGSIKFKTALGLIEGVEKSGSFDDGRTLVESSSGNLGVALSMICAARRYPFLCVVDPNTNEQNIAIMRSMGAEIVCVSEADENGGFLGTRLRYIRDLVAQDNRYLWLNQYENPANPEVHARTTATAIDRAFPKLDYLFVGVGTSGTLTGCVQHFSCSRPSVKIIGVDSVGSITFGLLPGKRHIPGLGSSQPPKLFHRKGLHALIAIPEVATVATCRHFARTHGMLVGGSSGTVLSAVRAWRQHFSHSDVVVAIAPDGGERYLQTIFNDDWVGERFGPLPHGDDGLSDAHIMMMPRSTAAELEVVHA